MQYYTGGYNTIFWFLTFRPDLSFLFFSKLKLDKIFRIFLFVSRYYILNVFPIIPPVWHINFARLRQFVVVVVPMIHWNVLFFQYPLQAVLAKQSNFPTLHLSTSTTDLVYSFFIDSHLSSVYFFNIYFVMDIGRFLYDKIFLDGCKSHECGKPTDQI